MSHPLKKTLRDGLWNAAASFLLCFSLLMLFSHTLTGEGRTLYLLLWSLLPAVLLSAADQAFRGKWKLVPVAAVLIVEGVLFFMGKGMLHTGIQSLKAETLHLLYNASFSAVYSDALRATMAVILMVTFFPLVRDDACGMALFVFGMLAVLPFVFRQHEALPFYRFSLGDGMRMLLPGLCGCLLMLSVKGGRRFSALAAALLVTAAAFLLLPPGPRVHPGLQEAARFLSDYRQRLFSFAPLEAERERFSLPLTGYQPQQDRLGGRVSPGNEPVLRVSGKAGERLYLRGRAYDEYTGLNWRDTLPGDSGLFSELSAGGSALGLFDQAVAEEELRDVLVTFLGDSTTTVFAPLHLRSFSGEGRRLLLYFQSSTEMYVPDNFSSGDSYSFTYAPETALFSREDDSASFQWAQDHYLALPGHLQSEIWEISQRVTAGLSSPYEKAKALCRWLGEECSYTLEVDEPPEQVDFVSYFLLGSREGYCTYFASALTVLCRMCGIPARYVSGYVCVPDASGTCVVTQRQGHAWTEIYLEHYGWVTLDATPGSSSGLPDRDSGRFPEPTASALPSPSILPTSSPAPAGSPSPASSGTPAPSASSPPAFPSPSAGSFVVRDPEWDPERSFLWLLLLLLPALFVLLAAGRSLLLAPSRLASRFPDRRGAVFAAAALQLLELRRVKKRRSETWIEFGRRSAAHVSGADTTAFFSDLSASVYGQERSMDPSQAERFYQAVLAGCGRWTVFSNAVRRAFRPRKDCFFP